MVSQKEIRAFLDGIAEHSAESLLLRPQDGLSDEFIAGDIADLAYDHFRYDIGKGDAAQLSSELANDDSSVEYVKRKAQHLARSKAFRKATAKYFRNEARSYKKLEPTVEYLNEAKDYELAAEQIEDEL